MKKYRFRHPGFTDAVAEVPCPELSDLCDDHLKRLVVDLRRRIMIRDVFDTVERFHWPHNVGMAVWFTLWQAAVDESHGRAWLEQFERNKAQVAAELAGTPAPGLGALLRTQAAERARQAMRNQRLYGTWSPDDESGPIVQRPEFPESTP